jgi:RNA polymerase sigma-70 factor (ECF subfamily)
MESLLRRLAVDVNAGFPDFVRLLEDDVFSGLSRLHPNEAEDLTQETFIRAYRALGGYPPDRIRTLQARSWIWTIALNLSRNRARDVARRPRPVPLQEVAYQPEESVDGAAWDRRLAHLAAGQRRAVVLRHVVGLSYREMAEALGRPQGSLKADVHRGLTKLKEIMEAET